MWIQFKFNKSVESDMESKMCDLVAACIGLPKCHVKRGVQYLVEFQKQTLLEDSV